MSACFAELITSKHWQRLLWLVEDLFLTAFLDSSGDQEPYLALKKAIDLKKALGLAKVIANEMVTLLGKYPPPLHAGTSWSEELVKEYIRLRKCMDDVRPFLETESDARITDPWSDEDFDATIAVSFFMSLLKNRLKIY